MTTRQSPSKENDATLTIEQWEKIGREVLELKCNYFNIPITGPTSELARLLYAQYHQVSDPDDEGDAEDARPRRTGRRKVARINDESGSSDGENDGADANGQSKFGTE